MTSWAQIAQAAFAVFLVADVFYVAGARLVLRLRPPEGWAPFPPAVRPVEHDLLLAVPRLLKQIAGCALAGIAFAARAGNPPYWALVSTWAKLLGPLLFVLVLRQIWRTYRWIRPQLSALARAVEFQPPSRRSSAATMAGGVMLLALMIGVIWTLSGGGAVSPDDVVPRIEYP